jgi:hypothetical protein
LAAKRLDKETRLVAQQAEAKAGVEAQAAQEAEELAAAEAEAEAMVEEVNPMYAQEEQDGRDEEEEEVLEMPHVVNPMHAERVSMAPVEIKPRDRSPSRESDHRAPALSNASTHAKIDPAAAGGMGFYAAATPPEPPKKNEKKKVRQQKTADQKRQQKELMADEAGWSTYDKQRRFRGKNPLRPTLVPEEEQDPEAVVVPAMMHMISKAEWMGLTPEERAQRMRDLDEINEGHVDENAAKIRAAGQWNQRAAGADVEIEGHVDGIRNGVLGGGGGITLQGSAHRASQQFRTEKFEGEIDAGYAHRQRGKSGLDGFTIKQLLEQRKKDEEANKKKKQEGKRFSWVDKMKSARKNNLANKWLARVASTPEVKKGKGRNSEGKGGAREADLSRKRSSAPARQVSAIPEEGEYEEDGLDGTFDDEVDGTQLTLSPRPSSPFGSSEQPKPSGAPKSARLTLQRSRDAIL